MQVQTKNAYRVHFFPSRESKFEKRFHSQLLMKLYLTFGLENHLIKKKEDVKRTSLR